MFSEAQKVDILYYLGWPARSLDKTSSTYRSILADRLNNVNNSAIETKAIEMVNRLKTIETRLDGASARVVAIQVDDIKLNPNEIQGLRSERRRLVRQLGAFLEIPVCEQGGVMFGVSA